VRLGVRAALEVGVDRLVLSWPFPPAPEPEDPAVVRAALGEVESLAAGVPWSVKGIPGCLVGRFASRCHRTANRWYVDADHRGAQALLFTPDLLRTTRLDACRWCALDQACDGLPTGWWEAGWGATLAPCEVVEGEVGVRAGVL